MGTPSEEVGYSLAITITLCTPAPLCPPPLPRHPAPFVVPPVSLLSSASGLAVFSFFPSQSFLIASLPCRSLSPRPPIILLHRPRLFRNCFQPSLLLLRLPLAGEFRVPFVTTYFTGVSLLLSLSLSLVCFLHCSSLSSPCRPAPQVGINFSSHRTFLRTFASPPTLCTSFHSRNGHRNS